MVAGSDAVAFNKPNRSSLDFPLWNYLVECLYSYPTSLYAFETSPVGPASLSIGKELIKRRVFFTWSTKTCKTDSFFKRKVLRSVSVIE